MKIAVNTRLLLKNRLEGIGWFTYECLKRITTAHPEHQFYFLFDRKYDPEFIFSENITPVVVHPQARHAVLFYIWFEISIPAALNKIKPDIFLSTDAYCSLRTPFKTLIVIHDLNFEHYPEKMDWTNRHYYRYFTPKFARRAERIATVSEFSKQDIMKQYGISGEKIDVVYNGANEMFKPVSEAVKIEVRKEFADGHPFFIFIGALNPRKNLINLFRAFDIFKENTASEIKLVVVGEKMYWPKDIEYAYNSMKFKEDVKFTGRMNLNGLTRLVGSALAMTLVSLFEGFGIPIVEAFYAGTPVITSNVSAMPEIAGDAALVVDPLNPGEIATAMERINTDKALRESLIEKGKIRGLQFSWNKTAANLWDSILKVVG